MDPTPVRAKAQRKSNSRDIVSDRHRASDLTLSFVSVIFAFLGTLVYAASIYDTDSFSMVLPLMLLVFCILYLRMRQRLYDLVLIEGIVLIMYTLVPHFGSDVGDPLSRVYHLDDGNWVHNQAVLAYFWSIPIVTMLIRSPASPGSLNVKRRNASAAYAAVIAGAISIGLSMVYVAKFGFVVGGDTDYADNFALKQTGASGLGIVLLSVPLSLSSLALALTIRPFKFRLPVLIAIASLLALFVVQGQRKYIVIPLLFLAVTQVRVKGLAKIILFLVAIAVVWTFFCYLGYLRFVKLPIGSLFDFTTIMQFWAVRGNFLAGETAALTATASAAAQHIISPLPYFGDYLQSWQMASPQFLFHGSYVPANERFAYAFNAKTAAMGQGWGFDFWGEAFVVGGSAGVALAAFAITALLRAIYVLALRHGYTGFWGAFAIMGSYFALWFQRNAFAYFLREYLVYGALILCASVVTGVICRLALTSRHRGNQMEPKDATS